MTSSPPSQRLQNNAFHFLALPGRLKTCLHLFVSCITHLWFVSPEQNAVDIGFMGNRCRRSFITTGNPISSAAFAASSALNAILFQRPGCRIPLTVPTQFQAEASRRF